MLFRSNNVLNGLFWESTVVMVNVFAHSMSTLSPLPILNNSVTANHFVVIVFVTCDLIMCMHLVVIGQRPGWLTWNRWQVSVEQLVSLSI